MVSSRELSQGRLVRTYRATAAGAAALTPGLRAVGELADEILGQPQ